MLFPYLLKVSLVLATLTLAYRWLIQFETFSKLNRVLLWFNVAAAWLLPLTPLPDWGPVEIQRQFHHTLPEIRANIPVATVLPAAAHFTASAPLTADGDPAPANWFFMIYIAGLLIFGMRVLGQITTLCIAITKSDRKRRPDGIVLVGNPETTSPFSFFRWIIYNPSLHSPGELGHILAHEAEHVKQHHSVDLLVSEIQRILLWFNPFSWYHRQLVQANLEFLADKAVLDSGFEKKRYQYDLLNAVMRPRELPLTNSFAQSLLKKRIKMINKKPSHSLASFKYAGLLVLVYICAAFVAPYRERIMAMAPAPVKPIVETLIEKKPDKSPIIATAQTKIEAEPLKGPLTPPVQQPASNKQPDKKMKGIMVRNDTLYWAITPLTTWDEINVMKQEFKNFDYELIINKLQFDPLQSFITSVSVHVQGAKNAGTGSRGEDELAPMPGYSGYVLKGGLGMGQLPPDPLRTEMEKDHQKALGIQKEKDVAFFEYELAKGLGPYSGGAYTPDLFEGEKGKKIFDQEGFGRSDKNTLLISAKHKEAVFYLNKTPSSWEAINKLPIYQIEKVSYKETTKHKMYFVIYTK